MTQGFGSVRAITDESSNLVGFQVDGKKINYVPTFTPDGTGLVGPGGGVIPLRGLAHQIVFIGDSIANQETPTQSGAFLQWQGNALLQNINYRLGARLNVMAILGLSGQRSDQIAAALPAFLAANPGAGYALVEAGQNDVAQYLTAPRTVAQFKASMIQIVNTCVSYGVTPILLDITGSASVITTAAMADMWVGCSRALRDIARQYPQVIFIPYSNAIIDVAAAFPANLASMSDGSFHPNSLGAKNIGDYCYTVLNNQIPQVDMFDTHGHAGSANELALTANPLMTGSGTPGAGVTGSVPTSTGGVSILVGGTGSAVASLSQNTNGPTGSQWCTLAYTGPASAVNGTDYVGATATSAAITLAAAGLAVGDVIQGFWEFNMTGTPANFMGAEIFLNFVGATGTVTPPLGPTAAYSRTYGMKQNNGAAPLVALGANAYGYGVMHTAQMPIPSGTTAIQMFIRGYPVSGSNAATFSIMLGRNRVLKVYA